jgi:hypothetical protein
MLGIALACTIRSRIRSEMIGGSKRSIRFRPIDCPSATVFHFLPAAASTAYLRTCCPLAIAVLPAVHLFGPWISESLQYPPGCSNYNPIEHRLFPHVTRKLQGLFLKSVEMFRDLARKATTRTGLRVFARRLRGTLETGKRHVTKSMDQLRILFEPVLPDWNYAPLPRHLRDVV